MPVTKPIIDFGLFDPAIALDSTPSATDIQPFSKIADLEIPNSRQSFASYEPDLWVLDGSYKFLPVDTTDVHVGWVSLSQSDAAGVFAVAPVLTVDFTTPHTVDGLTLRFSEFTGDWADSIRVQFYDDVAALIQDNTYTPTSADFYTAQAVIDFQQIVITFNSTNKPYRYLRLRSISYGKVIQFTDADIKSCTVVEEIDPISLMLPIGTMELTLFSSETTFNITDPTGDYFDLANRQPLDVWEQVDSSLVYIGHFFLDDWETPNDTETIFRCVDLVGLLDTISSPGGFWDSAGSQTYPDILDEILTPTGIPYILSGSYSTTASGWVQRGSVRDALRQIVYTSGNNVVVCARRAFLEIKFIQRISLGSTYSQHMTAAEKSMKQSLTLKPLVTGVELHWIRWVADSAATELFNDDVSAGDTEIFFDDPVDVTTLGIVGGTFVTTHPNYVVVNRGTSGNITVTGYIYLKVNRTTSDYNAVAATVLPNIVSVDTTMGFPSTSKALFYFNARYLQKMRLYAPTLQVGDRILVDTIRGAQVRILIEKMTLDLTGGFVCEVEGTGVIV